MADMVKRFCNTFLVEGLFIMVLGLMLLVLPQLSTLALSLMISVALILAGIYKLISSIIRRDEIEKTWLSAIIAILMIATGAYLTVRPILNLFLITMGIGIYFVLEGINSMVIAFESRGVLKHWWVGLVSGIIQFALAFIVLFGLPGTALYAIGILIGVNMLLSGTALISVYTGAGCRRLSEV